MAKGSYSVVHKGSDGDVIQQEDGLNEDRASTVVDDWISELEGDSGATLTVTFED